MCHCVQVDVLGVDRARLLTSAMLRGLLPEEREQIATMLVSVMTQQGQGKLTECLASAADEDVLVIACRSACAIVAALTVTSTAAAASQV